MQSEPRSGLSPIKIRIVDSVSEIPDMTTDIQHVQQYFKTDVSINVCILDEKQSYCNDKQNAYCILLMLCAMTTN